ncbi:uncharacterized protein EI90DRAFT_2031296 [Cantharellus anzutake]|uniref:uncharacterized protein n=1 Tax=Cantharellus anzutake TaxID=1750568 RepID=UPI001907E04F|nr:uncharacterized protein EI90DRAFT_2031296 [Cantharellus anzutake]KAF8325884.1 hypothetical protein EI90DRAFT_2031296 [Cantharellus anzutake]
MQTHAPEPTHYPNPVTDVVHESPASSNLPEIPGTATQPSNAHPGHHPMSHQRTDSGILPPPITLSETTIRPSITIVQDVPSQRGRPRRSNPTAPEPDPRSADGALRGPSHTPPSLPDRAQALPSALGFHTGNTPPPSYTVSEDLSHELNGPPSEYSVSPQLSRRSTYTSTASTQPASLHGPEQGRDYWNLPERVTV